MREPLHGLGEKALLVYGSQIKANLAYHPLEHTSYVFLDDLVDDAIRMVQYGVAGYANYEVTKVKRMILGKLAASIAREQGMYVHKQMSFGDKDLRSVWHTERDAINHFLHRKMLYDRVGLDAKRAYDAKHLDRSFMGDK